MVQCSAGWRGGERIDGCGLCLCDGGMQVLALLLPQPPIPFPIRYWHWRTGPGCAASGLSLQRIPALGQSIWAAFSQQMGQSQRPDGVASRACRQSRPLSPRRHPANGLFTLQRDGRRGRVAHPFRCLCLCLLACHIELRYRRLINPPSAVKTGGQRQLA